MIMAKTYDIEYEIAAEEEISIVSAKTLRELSGETELTPAVQEEKIDEEPQGFMSAAPEEEQNSMLGYDQDEDMEELEDE
jgi:hypothetical protein